MAAINGLEGMRSSVITIKELVLMKVSERVKERVWWRDCTCVRICVRVRVCVCHGACVRVRARVRVCVCVCLRACSHMYRQSNMTVNTVISISQCQESCRLNNICHSMKVKACFNQSYKTFPRATHDNNARCRKIAPALISFNRCRTTGAKKREAFRFSMAIQKSSDCRKGTQHISAMIEKRREKKKKPLQK